MAERNLEPQRKDKGMRRTQDQRGAKAIPRDAYSVTQRLPDGSGRYGVVDKESLAASGFAHTQKPESEGNGSDRQKYEMFRFVIHLAPSQ